MLEMATALLKDLLLHYQSTTKYPPDFNNTLNTSANNINKFQNLIYSFDRDTFFLSCVAGSEIQIDKC